MLCCICRCWLFCFFFKQKTAYEMRISDWSSDVCSSDLLVWHPVHAGDFFYIPANTVHAIGGGCSIIEIQQNSDITYRLYDYGRPRELHLDRGIAEIGSASCRERVCQYV